MDIYCISLLEPTLTEEDLGALFTSLPRRCVVLLEDIDSAGLTQRTAETEDEKATVGDSTQIGAEIAQALISVHKKKEMNKNSNRGISLSGLLNAIDGVASHEGRVLVMTTNFPEKLDDALIRPGRVDMKVAFTMATRSQMQELFVRMYSPDEPSPRTRSLIASIAANTKLADSRPLSNKASSSSEALPTPPSTPRDTTLSLNELQTIARDFADLLPDVTFSPAEVQGYLLTRKKEPRRALEEVEEWRDATLKAKEAKSRLAPV